MTASLILNWLGAEIHRSINKSAVFSKHRTPLGAHLSVFSHPLTTKLRNQEQMCSPSHVGQRMVHGLRCAISYWEDKRIPVTTRSKAWVCGRSLAGTAGSNPAGGMWILCCTSRYLCDGPIPPPGVFYRVIWVWSGAATTLYIYTE